MYTPPEEPVPCWTMAIRSSSGAPPKAATCSSWVLGYAVWRAIPSAACPSPRSRIRTNPGRRNRTVVTEITRDAPEWQQTIRQATVRPRTSRCVPTTMRATWSARRSESRYTSPSSTPTSPRDRASSPSSRAAYKPTPTTTSSACASAARTTCSVGVGWEGVRRRWSHEPPDATRD